MAGAALFFVRPEKETAENLKDISQEKIISEKNSGVAENILGEDKELATTTQNNKKDELASAKISADRLKKISQELEVLQKTINSLTPPASLEKPKLKSDLVYASGLGALVNILCNDTENGYYISASGAIIDPKGYILTNAHVAENFSHKGVICVIRRGSPAVSFARAKVVFMPDVSDKISATEVPLRDIAILKITSDLSGKPFSEVFSYFEFDPDYSMKEGEVLYSLGFPNEFLGSEAILKNTTILLSLGSVENLLNIDQSENIAEAAYMKGAISAQQGSSGGIFVDTYSGNIVGLFVALTQGETTSERKEFIFLSSYVDRIMREKTGLSLKEFLAQNP